MRKLVFLHSITHFEKYSKIENDFQDGSTKVFALTIDLRILLQFKKLKYYIQENYLTEAQNLEMDEAGFEICRNWYKDYFYYHGIALGLLLQWDLYFYFARLIRNIQSLLIIIEKEKPSNIISFKDKNQYISEFNDVLKYICSIKNIDLDLISRENTTPLNLIRPNQVYGERMISFLNPILESKPFKFCMHIGLKLLWALKEIKMKKFQKDMKQSLSVNYFYHQSVIDTFSKEENIILLDDQIDFRRYKDLLQNFKNLFLNKPGGYHIFFNSFDSFEIWKRTDLDFREYHKKWKKIIKQPDFLNRFKYKDISIWPLVKDRINNIISSDFKRLIKNILLFEKILSLNQFRAVILSNDVIEKAMTLVKIASKMKIPTIVVQHGITGGFYGFVPSYSTKFAAWGKISKEHLVEYGMKEEKIVVTGSPRFDDYISINRDESQKERIKKSIYKHFKIEKDKKLIVYAANPGYYYRRFAGHSLTLLEIEKMFSIVLNSIKNIPNSHLVIKIHPGDTTRGTTPKLLKKLIGIKNVSIIQNFDIKKLLVACDCAIAGESTTVLEILILGKPLICINFRERDYGTPYFEYNVAHKVTNYEEMVEAIQKALDEKVPLKKYEIFLKDYLYKLDGFSTKRIINLIKELRTRK